MRPKAGVHVASAFKWMMYSIVSAVLCWPAFAQDAASRGATLPPGFVYLRAIAPEIQQDIRYASSRNFTGRPVSGYDVAECLLTRATAIALRKVQARMPPNRALKVYDCYRPERAAADFLAWAHDAADQKTKPDYYPTVDKRRLFELGYISRSSLHSRGTAVDLTIVDVDRPEESTRSQGSSGECFKGQNQRREGNSLDFGTGYDCFHPYSATAHPAVGAAARQNRELLLREMRLAGFENYHREWWHFDYRDDPSRRAFDFPIRSIASHDVPRLESQSREPTDVRSEAPRFGSRELCGEAKYVKIVCVPNALGASAYANPSSTSRLVARFLPSSGLLECRRCLGDLMSYSRLDRVARLTSSAPWCLVEHMNEDGIGSKLGWVSARHLAPADVSTFECLH